MGRSKLTFVDLCTHREHVYIHIDIHEFMCLVVDFFLFSRPIRDDVDHTK